MIAPMGKPKSAGKPDRSISKAEIDALTHDVIGPFTQRAIDRLIEIHQHFLDFHYEPDGADSSTIEVTDPLAYWQSNLGTIEQILAKHVPRPSVTEEEQEHDEHEEGVNLKLQDLRDSVTNNVKIAEEKALLSQIIALRKDIVQDVQSDASVVNALHQHAKVYTTQDPNVPVAGVGSFACQLDMLQGVLKFRRDETNQLKQIIAILAAKVESLFQEVTVARNSAVETENTPQAVLDEIQRLRREQEYLYYRLYGPALVAANDPKVDKQRRYRKEIDETYKKMVDVDVAKRVLTAAKGADTYTKKLQAEVDLYKKMMKKAHLQVCSTLALGRCALNSNGVLETEKMFLEDSFLMQSKLKEALTSAMTLVQAERPSFQNGLTVIVPPEVAAAAKSPLGRIGGTFGVLEDIAKTARDSIHSRVSSAVKSSYSAMILELRSQGRCMGDEAMRRMCSSVSCATAVLEQMCASMTATACAVALVYPSEKLKSQALQQTVAVLADALPAACQTLIKQFTLGISRQEDSFELISRFFGDVANDRDLASLVEVPTVRSPTPVTIERAETEDAEVQTDPIAFEREHTESVLSARTSESTSRPASRQRENSGGRGKSTGTPLLSSRRSGSMDSSVRPPEGEFVQVSLSGGTKVDASTNTRSKTFRSAFCQVGDSVAVSSKKGGLSPRASTPPSHDGLAQRTVHTACGDDEPVVVKPPGPEGSNLVFLVVGISGHQHLWADCPLSMPIVMKAYGDLLQFVVREHDGYFLSMDDDAAHILFYDAVAALKCALSMHRYMMLMPFAEDVLRSSQAVQMNAADGSLIFSGPKLQIGLHSCAPAEVTATVANPEGTRMSYEGVPVTLAARIAVNAPPGHVLLSKPVADAVAIRQDELPAGMQFKNFCAIPGASGNVSVLVALDSLTARRPLQVSEFAPSDTLHKWVSCKSLKHDLEVYDRVCFVAVQCQSDVDFPRYNASMLVSTAAQVIQEAGKSAAAHRGQVFSHNGRAMIASFVDPAQAARFALSLQVKATQLSCPNEVLLVPGCEETYDDDGALYWRGLRIRIALHYARPDLSLTNRYTRIVQYFGKEVEATASMLAEVAYGDTLMTGAVDDILTGCEESLHNPMIHPTQLSEAGETVFSLLPRSLAARREELDAAKPEADKCALTASAFSLHAAEEFKNDSAFNYSIADKTAVLCVTIPQVEMLLQQRAILSDVQAALNVLLSSIQETVRSYEGYQIWTDDQIVSCFFFRTTRDAFACAMQIQRDAMHHNYPQSVSNLFEEILSEVGSDYIFRGPRISTAVLYGRVFSMLGSVSQPARYFGPTILQCTSLATCHACGGETATSEDTLSELAVSDPSFLQTVASSYSLGSAVLVGDQTSRNIFGLLPRGLEERRKYFDRSQFESPITIAAAVDTTSDQERGKRGTPVEKRRPMLSARVAQNAQGQLRVTDPGSSAGSLAVPHQGEVLFPLPTSLRAQHRDIVLTPASNAESPETSNDLLVLHREGATIVQRCYRTMWKVATKAGRVLGYPVEVDQDPAMFDSNLRDAIQISDFKMESTLFECEKVVLQRIEQMLAETQSALSCRLERPPCAHRSMQTAIIIPPSDKSDEALYSRGTSAADRPGSRALASRESSTQGGSRHGTPTPIDMASRMRTTQTSASLQRATSDMYGRSVSQSERTVQTSASLRRTKTKEEIAEDAALVLNAPGGFRPGLSADEIACRLRERRVMELEKVVEQLQVQNEILSLEANPVALALRGQLPPPRLLLGSIGQQHQQHHNETVDFMAHTLRPSQVAKPATPSVLDIVAAHDGRANSQQQLMLGSQTAAVVLPWKRHPPLSPLQSAYHPDVLSLPTLHGEATNELSAPFSKANARRATQAPLPTVHGGKGRGSRVVYTKMTNEIADAVLVSESQRGEGPRSASAPL